MTLDVMYSAASILVLVYFIYQCDRLEKSHFSALFYGKNTIQPIHTIKIIPAITAGTK